MGRLGDWLDQWEVEVAAMLRNIVLPEGENAALVDTDEICFFGSVRTLPRSMEYLKRIGTPLIKPEVYVVGMKGGQLIPANLWFAGEMQDRLESVSEKLMEGLSALMDICEDEGFTQPTAVKTAVVVSTGEAFTKYDFDPLPAPPSQVMSAADWVFDVWTDRIVKAGSALKELKDAYDRNQK